MIPPSKPKTVAAYIAAAPPESRPLLRELRALLRKAAPKAHEVLKWGQPAYEQERILFSFSAHKSHINFMPTGPAMVPFKKDLVRFRTGKDTIQLPYGAPLPKALLRRIAAYRLRQVKETDARWMY